MRLAEFILRDMEAILVEWEAFAVTLFPASANPTQLTLRDHAQQILEAVAKDLSTPQTRQAQADRVFAGTHQVAQSFIIRCRNVDRGEFAGPMQPR